MTIIECPRCDEGDERHEGLNVCGLCECRFTVHHGQIVNTVVNVGDELHSILADALKNT